MGTWKNIKKTETSLAPVSFDPGTITMISDADVVQLRQRNTEVPVGSVCCLHDLVTQRAKTQPEALAVDAWDSVLTYAELDFLSLRLAQSLVVIGVKPGNIVSLCFKKSKWTTVAMLGVLRAGAAFVLIDTALPLQRALKMIKLVNSTVLLTFRNVMLDLRMAISEVLFLDQDFFRKQPRSHSSIKLPISAPQDLAIVLFTSGSTGSPKAILQDHVAASTTAVGLGESWNIGPESRVLQFASYVFDMSVIDTFMTIVNGGCLCVPSQGEISADPAGVVQRMQINFSAVTASVASTYPAGIEKTLRTMVLGGEKVPKALIETWVNKLTLYNGYGPAEGSVCSFTLAMTSHPNSIGFPLNTLAWIVDDADHNRLMTIGEVGELLIEGPMLARGYLNDPEKTHSSFIEEPEFMQLVFGSDPKRRRRLYKTGDLVRQHTDGSLEYCGRKDLQTKLRGQRIELAEVEYNIQKVLPPGWIGIVDVVDLEAGATLVAFIRDNEIAQNRSEVNPLTRQLDKVYAELQNELMASLHSALPSFMVPSLFWLIPDIPMTLSRKTDRSALKRMGREAHQKELAQCANSGINSELFNDEGLDMLREQWSIILHLAKKDVDPTLNFFSLGGNSLLAMRLAGSLNVRLPRAGITVRHIFENPTMLLQSQLLKRLLEIAETRGSLQPTSRFGTVCSVEEICGETGFQVEDVEEVLEATDFQSNMLWAEMTADACEVHHCVLDFDFALETTRLEQALRSLMNQYSILRTCFVMRKGKVFQCILKTSPTTAIHIEDADMTCEEDGNLDRYEIGPLRKAFYLARWNLSDESGKTKKAVLRISHCMFDGGYEGGFLHRILVELSALYQGQSIPPSPAFSARCVGSLAQLDSGIAYWKETLDGATPARIVAKRSPQDATILRDEVSRTVEVSMTPSGITTASLVKAAWSLVLSELLLTKDVIFASITSGRALPIENAHLIIGPCISTIPNRIQINPSMTPSQFLSHVQNQYLDAIPHETVGLQTICQECTNWPRWEDLSTVVNDLSEENFIDRLDEDVGFGGGNVGRAKVFEKPGKWVDVAVRTKKVGNTLHARLAFTVEVLPRGLVEEMNDMLVANITMLSDGVTAELNPAPRGPIGHATTFPLPPLKTPHSSINSASPTAEGGHNAADTPPEISTLVSEAWRVVFGLDDDDAFKGPYFDKWPVACAWALRKRYEEAGYRVAFDEVLAHPSIVGQGLLLWAKRRGGDGGRALGEG